MREYTGPGQKAYEVAFVPGDPPRLAAADNTAAYVWPPDGGEPIRLAWDETAWGEPVLEVSPDGKWLAAGPTQRLRVWNVAARLPRPPRERFLTGLLTARFQILPDRLMIVCHRTSGGPVGLRIGDLNVKRGRPARWLSVQMDLDTAELVRGANPSSGKRTRAISDDGRRLALDVDNEVGLWDATTGAPAGTIELRGTPGALAFSPDGSRLAINSGTTLYVHDTATRELVSKWKVKFSYVPRLAWSPDGRLLARTEHSTTVRVYDPTTGKPEMAVGGRRGLLVSVAFSPDGLTLATGTYEGPVRVWDVG